MIILLSMSLSAQNRTDVIDTDVDVSSAITPVDVFANGFGLHIIYNENNALKYCRMDVLGNKDVDSPVTLESSSVVWPSITGDANTIYVVYRKSSENYIRTKYSTDSGNNWSYLSTSPNSSNASFIESVFSEERLHVTYQVSSSVYYSNYLTNWSTPYTVSDTENGQIPRIVAWNGNSENKVYFFYQNSTSVSKWREYNVTSDAWGSIQTAFSVSSSSPLGFAADGSNIALFYSYYDAPDYYFQFLLLDKSDNSLVCTKTAEPSSPELIYSTTTVDEKMHIVFWDNWYYDEEQFPGIWQSTGDENCDIEEVYTDNNQTRQNVHFINTSASSNDVYVIWQDDYIGNDLRLIYDDQAPLAPQNLTVTAYTASEVSHPKLDWSFNNEPDVYITTNAYEISRRTKPSGGSWSSWSVIDHVNGDENEYVDYDLNYVNADQFVAEYKLRAMDYHNNYSSYSSVVSITFGQFGKIASSSTNFKFNLNQNYPNPFNPTTTIKYSIQKSGNVSLKVYDMIGNEVANLVNENQQAGNYNLEFNASDLPSGIYVYRLTSGNFVDTKKLILLK